MNDDQYSSENLNVSVDSSDALYCENDRVEEFAPKNSSYKLFLLPIVSPFSRAFCYRGVDVGWEE